MPAQFKPKDDYQGLLVASSQGQVTVAEIFAALRARTINEVECNHLLAVLEKQTPRWQRVLSSF